VVTGRMVHGRLLPHIVRQCGACPVGVNDVVAVGATLRFRAVPRYHNNLRRGRRPRHPLFCLPQMLASDHCTLLCGCGGCHRLPPRFARRDTRVRGCRNGVWNTQTLAKMLWRTPRNAVVSPHTSWQQATHLLAAQHSAGAVRACFAKSGNHPTAVRGRLPSYPRSPTPRQASPLRAAQRKRLLQPPQYVAGIGISRLAATAVPV
jgi:hypothetical protein